MNRPKMNEVTYNSLYTRGPAVKGFGKEPASQRVFHITQKIGDVTMPGTAGAPSATLTPYAIQPGLPSLTGPYCAEIANYERYRLLGGAFMFKSTMEAGTKSFLGQVRIGFSADATHTIDTAYELNRTKFIAGKPTDDLGCLIECDPSVQPTYPRNGLQIRESTVTGDLNDYDWGNVIVELTAGADTVSATVGEIWFVGKVQCLGDPKTTVTSGRLSIGTSVGQVTNAAPLGTARTVNISRGVCSTITVTSTTITFPPCVVGCVFEMFFYWIGTSATLVKPTFTFTNCTSFTDVGEPDYTQASGLTCGLTGASAGGAALFLVRPNADNATLVLSGATLPVNSILYLYITALGYGLGSSEI